MYFYPDRGVICLSPMKCWRGLLQHSVHAKRKQPKSQVKRHGLFSWASRHSRNLSPPSHLASCLLQDRAHCPGGRWAPAVQLCVLQHTASSSPAVPGPCWAAARWDGRFGRAGTASRTRQGRFLGVQRIQCKLFTHSPPSKSFHF